MSDTTPSSPPAAGAPASTTSTPGSLKFLSRSDEGLVDTLRELEEIDAEFCRRSLKHFAHGCWPIIEPVQKLVWNWHLDELCDVLERAERGEPGYDRLIINVPPGTLKSILVSVIFRAWWWARRGNGRFLTASYAADLSLRDNVKLRKIVSSGWFKARFATRLTGDQNAKERFNTTEEGWSIATSVQGPGTGEHPDLSIIDDAINAKQSRSDIERQAANDWFDQTIAIRGVTRRIVIIVVMQRLHMRDLTGHLLSKARDRWMHICFPMRYEQCTCPEVAPRMHPDRNLRCSAHKADEHWRPDPRDHRTQAGELLCPELLDAEKVRQIEIDLGPYGTAGQLQQRPAPEGGGLFKREWFQIVEAAPVVARRVRGWDTAGSDGGGDYTVGLRLAEIDGKIYVEHVVRGQWGPAGVDIVMKQTADADAEETGDSCAQREEKEPGGSGKAIIAARLKLLAGHDYKGIDVGTDKITRARGFRAQCEGGNVFLVKGDWNTKYIDELCIFPNGEHDDQVDASSCAYNNVLLEPEPGLSAWIKGEIAKLKGELLIETPKETIQ